jgi:DNA-binding winged helix-turn-helix (wHTH) protein/tetratricopeptide (TPR) repeat protein
MAEFTFGPFTFDASASRLVRDDVEIRLRPQTIQVLRVLLQHSGRPVGYEQMIAEAWQGTFVSRHTVDVTVGELKRSLGEFGRWIVHRTKVGHSLEVPTSDELVRKGWHFAGRRTKEGAERAIECFEQASLQCPSDFRSFVGSSTCYLMQATFGIRSPLEVYPKFLAAHERAVELGGLTPQLRCNRAHGLHMFEGRLPDAEAEFVQALADKPSFATAHVRMALMYGAHGQLDRALEVLRRGYEADALLPTLLPTESNVLAWRREFDKAEAAGAKAVELHPYLQISRAAYAQALEFSGRLQEALVHYQLGSVMSGDLPWMRALEGTCLAKLGRTDEARAILVELEHRRHSEYADALYMAVLHDALGERSHAFSEIERAFEENSAFLYSVNVDPKMDTFRGDGRFIRLQASFLARPLARA